MAVPDPALLRICPFLGIPDDPGSHYSFPELGHRCHAKEKPVPIELGYQATFCLGGAYLDCPRFRTATNPIPAWHPAAREARVGTEERAATPHGRSMSGRLARRALNVLAALLMIVFLVAGTFILGSLRDPGNRGALVDDLPNSPTPAGAVDAASPTSAIGLASVVPAASPTAQETTDPGPVATPRPSADSSPSADPSPVVRIVQEGESLSIIAAEYGLTWVDLARANELENPDTLYVGQRLIIPIGPVPTPRILLHVVEAGETLASIAFVYGVTPADIARANDLEDRNLIYVGQRLVIPGSAP